MIGPHQHGHWTNAGCDSAFQNLSRGSRYIVITDFVDFDGDVHQRDEAWNFLGANFLPYDDGQSLFVSLDGKHEWQIRLQWRDEAQAHVLDHFDKYVRLEA
jgi:hypothetical protein